MGNFKVKVDTPEESKEAQELFQKLVGKENGFITMDKSIRWVALYQGQVVQYEFLPNVELNEITLPELRAMVNDQYAKIEQVQQDGLKFDNGKPRHSLLPKGSVSSIISVLEFGAKKYEANNWQKVDNAKDRYYDAAMRHIDSWWNGEKFDQETGIHHLAHAATNLFFLKWFDDKESNNG